MPQNTPRGYTYPLLSDVQNFPAQIQDLAQDIDADVEALDDAIQAAFNRDSARLSGPVGGTQAVASGAAGVTVTYSTEEYDNAGMANLGVNNDRLTIVNGGVYLIVAHVTFGPGPNTTWGARLQFVTTGATVLNPTRLTRQGHNTLSTNMTIMSIHNAPATSTIAVNAAQVSGASVNITDCALSATLMT